jgi:outer membrane protein
MKLSGRVALNSIWPFAMLAMGSAAQSRTLDEAIAAALVHAPEIAAADADADGARARLEQARAGRLPTAAVSGTIGYGRLDPQGFFGLGAANVIPRAAQITIEQPLFTGGRVSAGIGEAQAGIAGAEASRTNTRTQIVIAATQAYGDVLTAGHMVEQYDRLAGETMEIERQARLRYRAGESPSTDVSQAAARLAEADAGQARAHGMLVTARAHFSNLTGLEATGLEALPANPTVPATLDEAMEAAQHNNPMLALAEAGLRAAQAAARGAGAERLPTVGAFAEGASVRDQFFPGYRADSATVGVRARWDLFTGGRVSGKISEASSKVRAADARLIAARTQLEEQVVSAFQNVRTTQLIEKAAGDQSTATAQALESVRYEVRVGMKPQLDLLDAEREVLAAQTSIARARTDRIVAAYRLMALLGRQ